MSIQSVITYLLVILFVASVLLRHAFSPNKWFSRFSSKTPDHLNPSMMYMLVIFFLSSYENKTLVVTSF